MSRFYLSDNNVHFYLKSPLGQKILMKNAMLPASFSSKF